MAHICERDRRDGERMEREGERFEKDGRNSGEKGEMGKEKRERVSSEFGHQGLWWHWCVPKGVLG